MSSSFNANQLGVVIGGMVDTLYGAMIDWMTTAIAIQIGQGSCAGALSPAVAAMFDGYSVDPATGNVSAPADATFAQMRANGTFSQVLFQYLRSGASGAAPTSDPIWPLVADWAAKMPSGTDLTKYIIRQDLAVFDTFAAVWGGVWAAPGVMDLMYAVGAPYQTDGKDIVGRFGSDLLVFIKGCGNKEILSVWHATPGPSTLYMADVDFDDVRLDGTSGSLIITVISTGEKITFADADSGKPDSFDPSNALSKIVFGDGAVIDSAGFMALRNTVVFGKGDFAEVAAYTTKADTFVYASGDGAISIDAHLATGANVLKFADLNAANLTFTMDAAKNLIITDGVTGDRVTVLGQFSGTADIALFAFADGTMLSALDIQHRLAPSVQVTQAHGAGVSVGYAAIVDASAGGGTINGSPYNDVIVAGPGDTLNGYGGADTFVYRPGAAAVKINSFADADAANVSRIAFGAGISASMLEASYSLGNLVIKVNDGVAGDQITLPNGFSTTATAALQATWPQAYVQFADGSTMLLTELVDQAIAAETGTIYGDWRNNVIASKPGTETLNGYAGDDTYVLRPGCGTDTVADNQNVNGDLIQFAADSGVNRTNVSFGQSGTTIIVKYGASDQLKLSGWLYQTGTPAAALQRDRIEFADGSFMSYSAIIAASMFGTAASETINGTAGDDLIQGWQGTDNLNGQAGDDTYVFSVGDGADSITDTANTSGDLIKFDPASNVLRSNVTFAQSGGNLVIRYGASDTVSVIGAIANIASTPALQRDRIQFSDGSFMLVSEAIAASMYGSPTNATVTGTGGDDYIVAGKGTETLQGGLGADTYVLAAGDGSTTINDQGADKAADKIVFDPASNITAASLKVKQSGIDLVVQYGATDYLTLKGWIGQAGPVNAMNDLVELSDGQQLTVDQMVALSLLTPGQTTLRADWHGQTLNGTAGSDTFFGGAGNDVFNPGKGADTISGGAGADTLNFNAGDGSKNWSESAIAAHVLQFGAGISPSNLSVTQSGLSLILKDAVAGDQITLSNAIGKMAAGTFDQLTVKFADGSQKTLEDLLGQSLQSATGGLSLSGDYQPNTLFGRPGDNLAGGGGSDRFVFDAGFGKETISDFTPTGAQADLMDFAAALFPDFAAVQGAMSQVGANTVITLDAADVITLANVQKTALTAANFAFH